MTKAAIASRRADPVVADVIVIAGRDQTEMRADLAADVIVDRVPVDVTVCRAAAVDVIVTVIADHVDLVLMDLVLKMRRRPTVNVDRAKNIAIEIPDDTRATDHVKADQTVIAMGSALRADAGLVAEDRSMHADHVRADRIAKVDVRKVKAGAPSKRADIKATAGRIAKVDAHTTHAELNRVPQRRRRRDSVKKFRDSLKSYSAEVSRLNL